MPPKCPTWDPITSGRKLPKGIGSEGAIARPPPTLTHTQTTHDGLADGAVGGPVAADGAPIRKRGLAVVETAATKRKTDAETATGRQSRGNNESHTGMSASSRVEEKYPAMLRRGSYPPGTTKRKLVVYGDIRFSPEVDGMAHQPTASSVGRSTCCDGCMPRRTGDSVPSHRDHPIDLPINTVASATLGANKDSPDKFQELKGVRRRGKEG
ncbi:hypothetical protein BO79DRAFT_224985 [Aspergillus costaricaensis CBS 115574]|uniref:Uncharacterized protein n=1 Tax=Aspergillus costaricaensis CBS 115574 TaxID=1448317 RepID=A0ACD1IQX6_9EURO|nr:hypothetical protein BO79DRAFT_224985 [Aspergillus costaricaensis CBS 115574]RAK92683.1 hypothetical protein BO79DRAFT_224985 [Aspergillus costaricaensis CBS 115574]